jgi:hypothetical protein
MNRRPSASSRPMTMPMREPFRSCLTVYVSIVPHPSARLASSGAAQSSISACSPALRSAVHGAGAVLYTPAEYLLMMPPFAPTNPNDPGWLRARRTVSAIACIE